MSEQRRFLTRENLLLLLWSALLGLAAAAAFGAYRAVSVSDEDAVARLADFAQNLLWPGVLIFAGVATAIWLGWKANID